MVFTLAKTLESLQIRKYSSHFCSSTISHSQSFLFLFNQVIPILLDHFLLISHSNIYHFNGFGSSANGRRKHYKVVTPKSRISFGGNKFHLVGRIGCSQAISEEPIDYKAGWRVTEIASVVASKKLVETREKYRISDSIELLVPKATNVPIS